MRKKHKPIEPIVNAEQWKHNVLVGIPSLGQVRMEWHLAFVNIVVPMNWSSCQTIQPVPCLGVLNYHVAEAQNLIVQQFLSDGKWEWLLLLEDDVVVPPDVFLKFKPWIDKGTHPVVSGLYRLKASPAEPMVFRGRGNGVYKNWKMGQTVEVDGVPTGCVLINRKLLEVCSAHAPEISLTRIAPDGSTHEMKCREIFRTIRDAGIDPESGGYYRRIGTSDLEWCDQVMNNGYLKEAGFGHLARKKYPFIIDTKINCGHIDRSTGVVF